MALYDVIGCVETYVLHGAGLLRPLRLAGAIARRHAVVQWAERQDELQGRNNDGDEYG